MHNELERAVLISAEIHRVKNIAKGMEPTWAQIPIRLRPPSTLFDSIHYIETSGRPSQQCAEKSGFDQNVGFFEFDMRDETVMVDNRTYGMKRERMKQYLHIIAGQSVLKREEIRLTSSAIPNTKSVLAYGYRQLLIDVNGDIIGEIGDPKKVLLNRYMNKLFFVMFSHFSRGIERADNNLEVFGQQLKNSQYPEDFVQESDLYSKTGIACYKLLLDIVKKNPERVPEIIWFDLMSSFKSGDYEIFQHTIEELLHNNSGRGNRVIGELIVELQKDEKNPMGFEPIFPEIFQQGTIISLN